MKVSVFSLLAILTTLTAAQSSTPFPSTRSITPRLVTSKPLVSTTRKVAILKREAGFLEAEDSTEAAEKPDEAPAGGEAAESDPAPTEAANEAPTDSAVSSSGEASAAQDATDASGASDAADGGDSKTDSARDPSSTEGVPTEMLLSASFIPLIALLS